MIVDTSWMRHVEWNRWWPTHVELLCLAIEAQVRS